MRITHDAPRPAADVVADLVAHCRARGLVVLRTTPTPGGRDGRPSYVIELADPLPSVPADAVSSPAAKDAYPLSVFEVAPGWSRVATIPPTALVDLLGHPEEGPAARALEATLHDAIEAAVAGRPPRRVTPPATG